MNFLLQRTAPWLTVVAVMLMAWLAYRPGLNGIFHFDDFANLPILGAMGPIDAWPAFWRYITAGHADPTGRPVALLSFLIDAQNWPSEPRPFLKTNILIHLLNGVLLAALLHRLGLILPWSKADIRNEAMVVRMRMAAVVGAGFWTLHPLLVSTTLYVVQREAMLPATFGLLGLLLWLKGRECFQAGRTLHGLAFTVLGLAGCTLTGTLSKANGALLPMLALVIEVVALGRLAPMPRPGPYRLTMLLFALLPSLLITYYLTQTAWTGLTVGISDIRPWSLGQRLLTQPRVLIDYLQQLWLPRPFSSGLFNDQVEPSTSLFAPASTLPATLTVFGLASGAWFARKRFPLAATAILFYFAGHLLESSTIPLELQFEHRNYLPSLLMFWPLASWLCGFRPTSSDYPPDRYALLKGALTITLLLGLAWMTHARASLWGDPQSQALLWAEINPRSVRAQAYAASIEVSAGRADLAAVRLKRALADSPHDVQLTLGLLTAQCATGRVDTGAQDAAATSLATTRNPGGLLASWFSRSIEASPHAPCQQMNLDTLERLVRAAESNPFLQARPGSMQDLGHIRGRIELARGNADAALLHFNEALDRQRRTGFALEQAALLGASGHTRHGLEHIRHYECSQLPEYVPEAGMPRVHAWLLRRQGYWTHELQVLKRTLQDDLAVSEGIGRSDAH